MELSNEVICSTNDNRLPHMSYFDKSDKYFLNLKGYIHNVEIENVDYTNTYNAIYPEAKFLLLTEAKNTYLTN